MNIAIVDDQIADLRIAATFVQNHIAENFSETARVETFSNQKSRTCFASGFSRLRRRYEHCHC